MLPALLAPQALSPSSMDNAFPNCPPCLIYPGNQFFKCTVPKSLKHRASLSLYLCALLLLVPPHGLLLHSYSYQNPVQLSNNNTRNSYKYYLLNICSTEVTRPSILHIYFFQLSKESQKNENGWARFTYENPRLECSR